LKFIINEVKDKIIPPYTRIKRLVRDIPSTEIVAGADITNLRQLVLKERKENLKKLRRNSEEDFKKIWGKFYKRLWADLF
jgi:histone acetyltransferase (RNA polymerase elongator complex component)